MSENVNSTTSDPADYRAPNASGIDSGDEACGELLRTEGADDHSYLGGMVVGLEVEAASPDAPDQPATEEECILTPEENLARLEALREQHPTLRRGGKELPNAYDGATRRYVIDRGMPMHSPADPLQPTVRRNRRG